MNNFTQSCGVKMMALLENYGTELIFGIPGVHTLELYRGIAHSGIRHITPRHEQGAGFMADGYARATGKVGVFCTITGPGITNAVTAMAQSYSDSIPVLAISSVNKLSSLGQGRGNLHELRSQQKLIEQVTRSSHTVMDTESVPQVIESAFASFHTERPLPVHIEIPIDLIGQQVDWPENQIAQYSAVCVPTQAIEKAVQMLLGTDNVAVILGGGSKHASREAVQIIELLNAPVVTTFAAKGVVPEDHPLSLGANLLHRPVLDFLQRADVVLAVGTHLSETDIWIREGHIEFDGKLIRVDIDADQINKNAPADLGVLGDCRQIMQLLADLVGKNDYPLQPDRKLKAKIVEDLLHKCRQYWYPDTPQCMQIWDVIRRVLPSDGIVTADSTKLVYSGNFVYCATAPRTYLTSTTGYGTLGYALPAAIGAKLGKPQVPVVCVVGDGGMMYTLSELATAAEHKLPIVIVLWHNAGYGIIRDYFHQSRIPLVGVDLQMPDFIAIAKGFGCYAERVESLANFESQLNQAIEQDRPTLLEIQPDRIF